MKERSCPCCGSSDFRPLLAFKEVPLSGVFRKTLSEPLPTFDLEFELCGQCGLVRQVAGSGTRDYVEVTRSTALQFPRYVHDLIEKLRRCGVGADDLVLEIGANDGLFLNALRDAGFTCIMGIEPSQELANTARARGHKVICDYFSPDLVPKLLQEYGAAKAVICRHTLEHVPEPALFVQAMKQCLAEKNSLALIEVPDGSAIPELMNVYEFWDEHLYYFSPNNLARLLNQAGLQVIEATVQPHLETRNLLAWCKLADNVADANNGSEDERCVARWQRLVPRWGQFLSGFINAVQLAPRPIYAIGASHSQTNLINYADIGSWVDFFIDDDPAKRGLIPPAAETQSAILSTSQFESSAQGGSIIKTGFGYEKWTERLCSHATRHGMTILDLKNFIAN